MEKKQKLFIGAAAIALALLVGYFTVGRGMLRARKVQQIKQKEAQKTEEVLPSGPVSPITGMTCDNWNRRPVAVMQPADPSARPAAGFSDADMVFEMPVFTNSNTRLMGVYICNLPDEVGSIRSARHDYMPLAKSLDAVYVHWGYSKFAEELLKKKVVDNINCLTTSYCPRWPKTGIMTLEDTGHITKANIEKAMADYGYRATGNFSGYSHQAELSLDSRPNGGHLRLAYPGRYDVEYDYDKASNSFLRTWDDIPDTDKNDKKRVAPKNIVVMIAKSEQIRLADQNKYREQGVTNPWELIPEEDRAGIDGIPGAPGIGRYNNLQIGDPWFDAVDSGEAYFYMNGQEYRGTWKKDRTDISSKLAFFDQSGQEIKFVPGQIWVDVMEPGQGIRWEPSN